MVLTARIITSLFFDDKKSKITNVVIREVDLHSVCVVSIWGLHTTPHISLKCWISPRVTTNQFLRKFSRILAPMTRAEVENRIRSKQNYRNQSLPWRILNTLIQQQLISCLLLSIFKNILFLFKAVVLYSGLSL